MGVESYGLVGIYFPLLALSDFLDMRLSDTMNREMARLMAVQESRKILGNKIAELMEDALRHDSRAIKKILKEIVPEYTPQENEAVL
jgi:hypothetical protein